ncbi:saccharopine dehydrogenase C-terminal domain-containing protein [Legionella quateirensis]|uniref:Homospermidine synthase n=1 Tax=Legionella quateirensis TaxID=45072 RepID=A0A378KTZ6_9GAMM|nr:saccharopine dehydrogenase C-terminal domain-containing protein [Legionella quateirensis]KTD43408.1 homospermidine synthase [Legionella quateirensis]STY18294.1 homospermidine synthase [Legionella quateirensis]
MNKNINPKISFKNNIIMLGFGSIGKALLPLLLDTFDLHPSQITIITDNDTSKEIAQEFGVNFQIQTINSDNYLTIIGNQLKENDLLIAVSTGISTYSLITLCDQKEALFINAATELWKEEFTLNHLSLDHRTNYMLREKILQLKGKTKKTALINHGANPGLVSHFVKQALWNIAIDNGISVSMPATASEWAHLAKRLDIKVIHIAEQDSQVSALPKSPNEFINTWSIEGLILEGMQPAEIGWGTHEAHWPVDAQMHTVGPRCSIYLTRPSASTFVRSWTPSIGAFQGFMITHPETTSISHYLTVHNGEQVLYRPTVHYAYNPCPDARLSLDELRGNEWQNHSKRRLLLNEIIDGGDELGVLLMGNQKGAYWFGSSLSIHEVRQLAPYNNATSLQVTAGMISAITWMIEHPNEGLLEPEEIDHQFILNRASSYLGTLAGYYTDWTPLKNRGNLYPEDVDFNDPWQFKNIRVN